MHAEPPRHLWRVGRSPDPLAVRQPLPPESLDRPHVGNRFDSALGSFAVLYFAQNLEACFGEVLARFRPDLKLVALLREEWDDLGFMPPGSVPADWRLRRLAVQIALDTDLLFLDVESLETREMLRTELADVLVYFGYSDLDVSVVRGRDRRVTRYISQWAYDSTDEEGKPVYAGIRYQSRMNSEWECWAVFEDVVIQEVGRYTLDRDQPDLKRVAERYGLIVH